MHIYGINGQRIMISDHSLFPVKLLRAARNGTWSIVLTPTKPVPRSWFPDDLNGKKVLCLASGGGQQEPVLAATGADVTVFDNSPGQLQKDTFVAERDGLKIKTVQGNMQDLSPFADSTFDMIVHPWSNNYVDDVIPVWKECARVLKKGGTLIAGFCWGHPLEDNIQGQISAGFVITGFYEDKGFSALDAYINTSMATKALKI